MDKLDKQVGQYAFNVGWPNCWKCGKPIQARNYNEVTAGIHGRCETKPWRHGTVVMFLQNGEFDTVEAHRKSDNE